MDIDCLLSAVVAAKNFLKIDSYVMMQIQQDIWTYFKKLVHIYPFQLGNVIMSSHRWFPHSFLLNLKLLSWHHYNTTGAYGLKNSSTVVINLVSIWVVLWCGWIPFTDALCSFYRWSVHNWCYISWQSLSLSMGHCRFMNSKILHEWAVAHAEWK